MPTFSRPLHIIGIAFCLLFAANKIGVAQTTPTKPKPRESFGAKELPPSMQGDNQIYTDGLLAEMTNDYAEAISLYTQGMKESPKAGKFPARRAYVYELQGKYDLAIKDATTALGLSTQPDLAGIYATRGKAYLKKGDVDRALNDLHQAIQLDPKFDSAVFDRALAYLKKGNRQKASDDFATAIRQRSSYAQAPEYVAFRKTLPASGKSAGDYIISAKLNLQNGQPKQAAANATEAVRLEPKNPSAYNTRGQAYLQLEKYTEAAQDFTEAIKLEPKIAAFYYNRGIAAYKKMDFHLAVQDFRETLRLEPNDGGNKMQLSRVLAGRAASPLYKGTEADILNDLAEAIRLDAKNEMAYFTRARRYSGLADETMRMLAMGNQQGFITTMSAKPNLAERLQLALTDYAEVIRLVPKEPQPLTERALVYRILGQTQLAQADEQKAASLRCPKIRIKSATSLSLTKALLFSVELEGNHPNDLTYNWIVSDGTITEGQGTGRIKVSMQGLSGTSVTTTVEVGGLPATCSNTASNTAEVTNK